MKGKTNTIAIVLGSLVAVLVMFMLFSYNKLVGKEEKVEQAWAQVENVYQRRADLIPNLVAVVREGADFEQRVQVSVAEIRSAAASAATEMSTARVGEVETVSNTQSNLGNTLASFMIQVEAYPELNSSQAFRELHVELVGTEGRINVERRRYNEAVREYNQTIRKFPMTLAAGALGFEARDYFEITETGQRAVPETFGGTP